MSERRDAYLKICAEVHDEWARSTTPIRFAPDEHPDHSDYNVEVLAIEATGEQLDRLDAMKRERLAEAGLLDLHPVPIA